MTPVTSSGGNSHLRVAAGTSSPSTVATAAEIMGSEGQRRAGGGKTHSKVHKSFILDDNSDDDEIDENDDNETSYLDSLNEAIESPEYDENSYQQFGDSNLNVKAASSFDTRQDNRKYFNTNKILEVHDIFGVSEDEDDESQNANYNDENLPNADPNATSDDTYSNISFIAKDDEDQSEHGGSYGSAHEDHVKDIRDKKRQELAVKEDPTDDVDKVNIDNKLDEKKTEGKILKAHLGPGLKRATISDRFTQDECEQHFLTARQQIVALRDVPERFLTCDPVLTPPESMAELEAEAEWIYQEIFSETPLSFTQYNNKLLDKGVLPKIRNTLDLLRNQYLEVPFIFTYRKEFVFPGLNISDLWKIYEYNSKWSNLKQQKAALNTLVEAVIDSQFEKCVESNQKSLHNTESVAPFSKLIDQTMINTIASLTEFEKIDDHLLYLNFYFSDILVKKHLTGDNQKIPTTNSIYARCRELNLTQVSANFGLLPHQLAENLVQNFSVNNVQQRDEDLSAVAEPYICDQLPTIAKVIEAIIWLVAHEISVEPAINDFVRKQIYEHSLVSTKPTRQGLDQIDKTHPYFQYKYLKNKPLSEFQQTEFLEIFDAEDQGFLEVIFRLEAEEPGKSKSSLFEQMLQFYQINQYSLISQSWDKYRQKALNIAVNHLILPRLFNDLKVKLRAKSKEYLLDMYCVEFNALISSPPFFSSQRPNSSQNTQSGSSKNYSDTINQENPSNSAKINHSETPKDDLGWGDDEDDANESIVKQPEQVETPSSRTDDANKLDASDIQKMIDRAAAGDPESNELASSPKIMSFVYSNDPQVHVAVVCILDAHGNFIDHLLLNNFDYGRLSSASNITLKANDVKEVKDFIKLHQPTDIVLSTQSSKAKNFRFEFRMILSRLSEDFMQAKQIELHYSDHRVANLYKNSSLASKEFPNLPPIVHMSISLGRYFIDPLFETAQLFNTADLSDFPLLGILFHPLQRLLDREAIYWQCYKILITRINQHGVDLSCLNRNTTSGPKDQHRRLYHMLEFISGLGPCKVAAIRRRIIHLGQKKQKGCGLLLSRANLVTDLLMGPYVFANCSGFIRFPRKTVLMRDPAVTKPHLISLFLDSTRIHPESYHWAIKIAQNALKIDDSELSKLDAVFSKLFGNYGALDNIDMEQYAEEIHKTGFGNKRETLFDIRSELKTPFVDLRGDYELISPRSLFELFYNDHLQNIQVGKIVIAKIISFAFIKKHNSLTMGRDDSGAQHVNPLYDEQRRCWICTLCKESNFSDINQVYSHVDRNLCRGRMTGIRLLVDDSVVGYVPLAFISDEYNVPTEELNGINPKEKVKIGMLIHCVIKKINHDRQEIIMSCRTSDLQQINVENIQNNNGDANEYRMEQNNANSQSHSYIDEELKEQCESQITKKHSDNLSSMYGYSDKSNTAQQILPRKIVHAKFKNVNFSGAHSHLKSCQPGEMLFRPQRGKVDHLTLTWKVANPDIVANISIQEGGKQTDASLGNELYVEGLDVKFDDLDEIIYTLGDQLQNFAYQVTSHKYYEKSIGDKKEAEKWLSRAKTLNPSRVPYIFSMNAKMPGKVMISYMPNKSCNHEMIDFIATGYKFRSLTFTNFEKLIAWFKVNFNNTATLNAIIQAQSTGANSVFNLNGGKQLSSMSLRAGGTITEPIAPTRPRYVIDPNSLPQIPNTTIGNTIQSSRDAPGQNIKEFIPPVMLNSVNAQQFVNMPHIINPMSQGMVAMNTHNLFKQVMLNQANASQLIQGLIPPPPLAPSASASSPNMMTLRPPQHQQFVMPLMPTMYSNPQSAATTQQLIPPPPSQYDNHLSRQSPEKSSNRGDSWASPDQRNISRKTADHNSETQTQAAKNDNLSDDWF